MKPKIHDLPAAPLDIFSDLIALANLSDTQKAVKLIAARPELVEFAQKFSGWLFALVDERQLLARVNSEVARREIEMTLSLNNATANQACT